MRNIEMKVIIMLLAHGMVLYSMLVGSYSFQCFPLLLKVKHILFCGFKHRNVNLGFKSLDTQ